MAEAKQTTTAKKTTAKKPTKKATETPKPQPEPTNPLLDLLSGLTPDQLANLVALAQGQQPVEAVNEVVEEKPKKITMSYLNRIRDREVEVRNVVNGRVTFHSQKTGITYIWTYKAQIELMSVGEILTMYSKNRKFLTAPWLVVDDSEVNEGLGLHEVLETVDIFDDLDSFLELPFYKVKEYINSFSIPQRQQLADHISVKIKDQELRDIVLIQNLQEALGTEFLTIK